MTLPLIVIITATTGKDTLRDTIESVQKQSYPNIRHIIVCDGKLHEEHCREIIANYENLLVEIQLMIIPWQTGKDNWVCHRIYSAIPNLIVEDAYVSFLDEDNYVDPEHYATLYNTICRTNSEWAYSLRKVVTKEKEFVAYDMCESLGKMAYVWVVSYELNTNPVARATFKEDPSYFLVDTNCYLIKKEILHKISHNWQRPARQHPEADRLILNDLSNNYKGECTMKYTMNYRLDGRRGGPNGSAVREFYERGNKYMNLVYDGTIPWAPNHSD
jgi:glycosyltransferase involved in cell wall biosynthesis